MIIEDISILIAEDEAELREYLYEFLQLFFKHVYVAACGHDAYIRYLDKKPDIILSDINMPNLDGLSMISRIRKRDMTTQIIIMSAHSEREKLLHAIKLHLVTYLIKPIQTEKLKEILFDVVETIRAASNRIYLNNGFYWEQKKRCLYENDVAVALSERELMLLELLCSKANKALSSEQIFYHLYAMQSEKEFSEYTITSLIKRLRKKLPKDTIQNEYGLGYKIVTKSHF